MARWTFLTFFFSSTLFLLPIMVAANDLFNNTTDKMALLALKLQITNDPSDFLRSWNDTTDLCNWVGIFCSKKHSGRVVSIDISSRGLEGIIPFSIENMTFLYYLNLSQNHFYNTIPPSVFRMPRLHILDLSANFLEGEIPYNLSSSFTILNLKENNISGIIPSSLQRLSKLTFLSLSKNNINGKIPLSLGNLSSSLQHLDLLSNQLEGTLPEKIGNRQNLQFLQVSENKLSGELPPSIFNLSSALYLSLAKNNFEGIIPMNFGDNLPNLKQLLMGKNQFKGPIPASLPNASKLYFIDMSSNSFNGIIPSGIGRLTELLVLNLENNLLTTPNHNSWLFFNFLTNCSSLKMLYLSANNLTGTLPRSIANLSTSIQKLEISFNQISGSIPPEINNLLNLTYLGIGSNFLTGTIPESIGKLQRLQFLSLSSNMLIGSLPFSIGNLTQMLYLYLSSNGFNGPIPPSIGKLKSLTEFIIHRNNLNGNLPTEVFTLPNILLLDFSFNSLNCHFPSELSGWNYIRELYFFKNIVFGEIPIWITSCVELEVLNFGYNLIQGTIPSSIGDLKRLKALDLSKNNMTGKIPKALGTLRSLVYLNFSFNHFVGEVPNDGIFMNLSWTSLQGNYGLCSGVSNLHLLACPNINSSKKRRRPMLAILLPSMAVFSLIVFSIFCFICKRKKIKKNSSKQKNIDDVFPKVSYAELVSATNGFSPANLLGVGQYGSVYKGSLENYGYTFVAVKVFNLQRRGASKSFAVECEALRHIRHRNLVKTLTCCVGIDSKGDDFMAIVFEFMKNGNLDTWLHADDNTMEHLDFGKRLDIAINIADALCYLHHDCETPIIHCDLKPSNVLLDGEMIAHVGDFGLARLLHKVVSNPINDSDQSFPVIRGTVGYVAPEYGVGSHASSMGDVYSYGILLMELFTGRRPVDEIFKDGLNLHNFVKMTTPDQVMKIIDMNLLEQFQNTVENGVGSRMAIYECLTSILQLSLSCSNELARERISMEDVAVKLYSIRDQSFKAGLQRSF